MQMKTGRTLTELAQEIERQSETKKDYVAPTPKIGVHVDNGAVKFDLGDADVNLNDLAHQQVGEHTGIPAKYYDKMRREAPELLGDNIKAWFDKYPAKRMVRTLDTNCRA